MLKNLSNPYKLKLPLRIASKETQILFLSSLEKLEEFISHSFSEILESEELVLEPRLLSMQLNHITSAVLNLEFEGS